MSPMTHKERILAAIDHQPVDRLPTDIWAVNEILDKLAAHFGVHSFLEICEHLNIDGIFDIAPPYIGPQTRQDNGKYSKPMGHGFPHAGISGWSL